MNSHIAVPYKLSFYYYIYYSYINCRRVDFFPWSYSYHLSCAEHLFYVSGRLIADENITVNYRQLFASFLQMALLSDDVISACSSDANSPFADVVRSHKDRFPDDELATALAKCVRPSLIWFLLVRHPCKLCWFHFKFLFSVNFVLVNITI